MKAIILMSGGIDSAVVLALALEKKFECLALSFDYGQRHRVELNSANAICEYYEVPQTIIPIDPTPFARSSLLQMDVIPHSGRSPKEISESGIPNTYVPARNTLFLSYSLGFAEINHADEIHFGMNLLDRTGYPDCRPEYLEAFQKVANLATKQSLESKGIQIIAPLINWNKARIIFEGMRLNVPLELTFSCYNPTKAGLHCGKCDACILRNDGFQRCNII